jgi:hypothetical protein
MSLRSRRQNLWWFLNCSSKQLMYVHSQIDLNTNLQAIAVQLSLNKTITLCSIYIPPNYQLQSQEIINLIQQLPIPFLIMGDFNAHNPL